MCPSSMNNPWGVMLLGHEIFSKMWLSLLRFKSFMAFLRGLPAPMTVWESKVSSEGLFGERKKAPLQPPQSLSKTLGNIEWRKHKPHISATVMGDGNAEVRGTFPNRGYKSTTGDSVSSLNSKQPTGFLNTYKPLSSYYGCLRLIDCQ